MSGATYSDAVQCFEALLSAALQDRHATPASLIRAAGLPVSSGYRHVATLEAEGFLGRDRSSAYLPGQGACRTGLFAHGAGYLAPVAEALVTQLQQATQHSVFLGLRDDLTLHVGPHAPGRLSRLHRIQPRYVFESLPNLDDGTPHETGLLYLDGAMARRAPVLVIALPAPRETHVMLGLLLGGHRSRLESLADALCQAQRQISAPCGDIP